MHQKTMTILIFSVTMGMHLHFVAPAKVAKHMNCWNHTKKLFSTTPTCLYPCHT